MEPQIHHSSDGIFEDLKYPSKTFKHRSTNEERAIDSKSIDFSAPTWRDPRIDTENLAKKINSLVAKEIPRIIFSLQTGGHFFVEIAYTALAPYRHFVTVFPMYFGKPNESQLSEIAGASVLIARQFARTIAGDPECYAVSKNGANAGSVPKVDHSHIFVFRSREDKMNYYKELLLKGESP